MFLLMIKLDCFLHFAITSVNTYFLVTRPKDIAHMDKFLHQLFKKFMFNLILGCERSRVQIPEEPKNTFIVSYYNVRKSLNKPLSCMTLNIFSNNAFLRNWGAQWLSGRVLDSRPRGRRFQPQRRHCVVVLEQDTFILA